MGLGFKHTNLGEDINLPSITPDQGQSHSASWEGQAESLKRSLGMSSSGSQGTKGKSNLEEGPGGRAEARFPVTLPHTPVTAAGMSWCVGTYSPHLSWGLRHCSRKDVPKASVRKAHLSGSIFRARVAPTISGLQGSGTRFWPLKVLPDSCVTSIGPIAGSRLHYGENGQRLVRYEE